MRTWLEVVRRTERENLPEPRGGREGVKEKVGGRVSQVSEEEEESEESLSSSKTRASLSFSQDAVSGRLGVLLQGALLLGTLLVVGGGGEGEEKEERRRRERRRRRRRRRESMEGGEADGVDHQAFHEAEGLRSGCEEEGSWR